ncbi:MAG: M23 family metallopeptidase [Bacteroidia bacterium]
MRTLFILFLLIQLSYCEKNEAPESNLPYLDEKMTPVKPWELFFKDSLHFHADGFNFPVGIPDAKGYYNAQSFQENHHLGDDWNAVTGGNTDLGDPVYATANGYVNSAKHEGPGWGNVIRIIHYHKNLKPQIVESVYAHCDTILVRKGQAVIKGEKIGTIGNADGAYLAHLHFEIRDSIEWPIGGGYFYDTTGYMNPTRFIKRNRTIDR